jgi:hypothetical protein
VTDDAFDAELADSARVSCPYCGESVELLVDAGGGTSQSYVEDCDVCCRPWSVRVTFDGRGRPTVTLSTLDED